MTEKIRYNYTIIKRRLLNRMANLPKKMDRVNRSLAFNLAMEGGRMARAFAPNHTGKTTRLIRYRKGRDVHESMLVAQNPLRWRKDGFNLPYWMHYGKGSGRNPRPEIHIKTGNPRFMFAAKAYIERIKARQALNTVKKQKI